MDFMKSTWRNLAGVFRQTLLPPPLRPRQLEQPLLFILFLNLFIYLFLAAFSLHCCTRAFSSCMERGLLFVAVRALVIAVASLRCGAWALGARASVVVARRLSSCGSRALESGL